MSRPPSGGEENSDFILQISDGGIFRRIVQDSPYNVDLLRYDMKVIHPIKGGR